MYLMGNSTCTIPGFKFVEREKFKFDDDLYVQYWSKYDLELIDIM